MCLFSMNVVDFDVEVRLDDVALVRVVVNVDVKVGLKVDVKVDFKVGVNVDVRVAAMLAGQACTARIYQMQTKVHEYRQSFKALSKCFLSAPVERLQPEWCSKKSLTWQCLSKFQPARIATQRLTVSLLPPHLPQETTDRFIPMQTANTRCIQQTGMTNTQQVALDSRSGS